MYNFHTEHVLCFCNGVNDCEVLKTLSTLPSPSALSANHFLPEKAFGGTVKIQSSLKKHIKRCTFGHKTYI